MGENALPTNAEARKIVARGARLLDRVEPSWFRKVKLKDFHLDDPSMCVLGYVYKDFTGGLATIAQKAIAKKVRFKGEATYDNIMAVDEFYYGFNVSSWNNENYEVLGQQWVRAINRRRQAASKRRKK